MKNFFPSRAVSCSVLLCCCSFNLEIKLYNKTFINQAFSVKMAGYWPRSLFCFSMDLDFVSVHKNAKKKKKKKTLGQYPAILSSRLVNNAYLYSS